MMTEPNTRSGVSTASVVLAAVAFVLTLVAYGSGIAFALVFGILASVVGLTLGIVAKREAAITVSVIALLFGLAIGFGVMTY